ncbi:hypothetical protein F5Y04DRAFT_99732 [Hypomontagnella monticulosa]|nr:hypothetical protein F5Y04DRAFT_99732 [Hypomontagnella monticulosa]
MAGEPPDAHGSKPSSPGAIVTALCVTLAVLIFVGALRMRRSATLSMIKELNPRRGLPDDQIDSIPIVKYGIAKRKYLASSFSRASVAAKPPDGPLQRDNPHPQAMKSSVPRLSFKGTARRYWSRIRRQRTPHDIESTARDVQESCPTCTEDFLDNDNVRLLPCKHIFHPRCIDTWFKRGAYTCPLCRFDLRIAWMESGLQRPMMARLPPSGLRHV